MEWHTVLRELHLHGGGRLLNGMDPKATVRPNTVSNRGIQITLKSFESLYSDTKKLGLNVIGCDFYTTEEASKGFSPPEWRSKNIAASPTWLCADQGHGWSFIAHGAFKQKNGLLYDLASRISHQLRACEWRLRQLSEAYAEQLNGRLRSKPFTADERFLDGYTSLCYLALQSFLVDACVLRDYLSEFYSEVMIRSSVPDANKITTLSGLLKKWRSEAPKDAAGRELNASAKHGQWLFELGAYRDLVVHVAPLANAGKTLFAVTRTIELTQGELLPAIKLPLPSDPAALTKERVSGRYFEDPELTFARFKNVLEDISSTRDSLEYAHITMQQLGALASSVSKISPIKPEVPLITPQDVIGEIKITGR
ncbi:hypothetical protein [Pseudomonas tremae]|uniref:hypothetical protein n=1 Tax=Pseudomonas tremae TaxID=200454 RepID=UPI001F295DF6|nr:hypothetical protein [Pseudomonas tremae]MCF5806143.1 hypothetical protein [Pseudomonas tremae]MCF5810929.1 hypothetical protein [Pseudomonas tremae]